MSYAAVVCKVSPFKHPNADRLQIVMCKGVPVIVGQSVKDGDVGLFFPVDGKLSDAFCKANGLYATYDENGKKTNSGYIEQNGQIKAQKIRGVKSYGLWMPISCLSDISIYAPVQVSEGEEITHVNGTLICEKYLSPQTQRAIKNNQINNKNKGTREHPGLPQHPDTPKFTDVYPQLPEDADYTITLKLHGTSQRSAKVMERVPRFRFFPWFFFKNVERMVHGTRRVPKTVFHDAYRQTAASLFECLPVGWAAYYEIVGYENEHTPIHGAVSTKDMDPKIRKKYGDKMLYTYGCKPGEHSVYVYNITANGRPLSQLDMEGFCERNGLDVCPVLLKCDKTMLKTVADELVDGQDPLDASHIREGVVIRMDRFDQTRFYKHKSHDFLIGEGVGKAAGLVDVEEIESAQPEFNVTVHK